MLSMFLITDFNLISMMYPNKLNFCLFSFFCMQGIQVRDNDSLSALLAANIQADLLILMSDVDGIYNKPPWVSLKKRFTYKITFPLAFIPPISKALVIYYFHYFDINTRFI